jgi:hypothetical protein
MTEAANGETCVIRIDVVKTRLHGAWDWRLIAETRSATGVHHLGQSPAIQARPQESERRFNRVSGRIPEDISVFDDALETLTKELVQSGWEPQAAAVPYRNDWILRHFRRQVSER